MNSRHNLLLQIAVITLLSRLPWVASQVWWVRADPPWNLKIYKIPRKIFLIVRRVRKFIFKISHKWDKLPPWSCWNLFQKHELKWMGWWEHKTLRYALKIMKTKFIFFMFSSSHSCMWPSVSCSHAPNNWIKLWSAARLQTITMSAPVQFIDTPRQAWHMSSDISGQAPDLISNLFCYRSELGGSLTCHLVTGLVSPRPHLTHKDSRGPLLISESDIHWRKLRGEALVRHLCPCNDR